MLHHPVEASRPILGKGKEIALRVAFRPDGRVGARDPQGRGREIEPGDLAFTPGGQRADIVSRAASRHEDRSADRVAL